MVNTHPLKVWIDRNTTQAKFARHIGVSPAYLSEILSGKAEPSLALADKLSAATGRKVRIEKFVRQPAEVAE